MSILIYTGELDSANIQSSGADKAFLSRLEEIYDKVLRDKGCVTDLTKDIEISLTFLDSQKMREINNEYRNVDEPTDVLSFPLWESEDGLFTPPDDWEVLPIGDIMVCPEIVKKNAAENGRTHLQETVLVISHGLLHLIGYDHDTEERQVTMWREQDDLVREFFAGYSHNDIKA